MVNTQVKNEKSIAESIKIIEDVMNENKRNIQNSLTDLPHSRKKEQRLTAKSRWIYPHKKSGAKKRPKVV